MMKKFLKFGEVSSSKMKKWIAYKNSYFLDEEFDFAIIGVDYVTNSVIYSLSSLVNDMVEELKDDPDFDQEEYYPETYCIDHYYDLFGELQKNKDLVPPTLSFDIEPEFKKDSEYFNQGNLKY